MTSTCRSDRSGLDETSGSVERLRSCKLKPAVSTGHQKNKKGNLGRGTKTTKEQSCQTHTDAARADHHFHFNTDPHDAVLGAHVAIKLPERAADVLTVPSL